MDSGLIMEKDGFYTIKDVKKDYKKVAKFLGLPISTHGNIVYFSIVYVPYIGYAKEIGTDFYFDNKGFHKKNPTVAKKYEKIYFKRLLEGLVAGYYKVRGVPDVNFSIKS